jgi:DNA polymerase
LSDLDKHLKRLYSCGIDRIYLNREKLKNIILHKETDMENEMNEDMIRYNDLKSEVSKCKKCNLHKTRTNVVFGEGNPEADIVFIGEAPGADEDRTGIPFVGRAGQLLDKMFMEVGLNREDVYICNILKCRPPGNRDPEPDEVESCSPYLEEQLEIISPTIIVALGAHAIRFLTGLRSSISKMRDGIHHYKGIRLVPTYHPAACFRTASFKKDLINDLKIIKPLLEDIKKDEKKD